VVVHAGSLVVGGGFWWLIYGGGLW